MTQEQYTQTVITHTRDIAALWESLKSAHKRIDDNDENTKVIHTLAVNSDHLIGHVKTLADSLREQGKRIGAVETAITKMSNLTDDVKSIIARIDKIEKEPAQKWKDMVKQITGLIVAAVIGAIITRFTM